MSTLRMNAIYTYLQRVLRPIWDMNITYRHNLNRLEKQLSNMHMFLPALRKLQHLKSMLDKHLVDLCRQTTIEDQVHLLRQDTMLNTRRGISSSLIHDQVDFCHSFDIRTKDKVEVAERKALKSMQFFIRRCIDVIEFIKAVSFDGNDEKKQKELF